MSSYTSLQQDRQARNRPSHQATAPAEDGCSSASRSSRQCGSARHKPGQLDAYQSQVAIDESFEERERRHQAAMYLDSNEMLIWWAMQRNESVPQTRLHFEKILAGLDSDGSDVEWEERFGPDSEDERRVSVGSSKGKSSGSRTPDRRGSSRASYSGGKIASLPAGRLGDKKRGT